MGILALIDYHIVEELCEKLKTSKGTFTGRLKDENETSFEENGAVAALKLELAKAKNKSRKRKREKVKAKSKSPVRFRQNQSLERESDSTSDSCTNSTSSGQSTELSSDDTAKNKLTGKSGAKRFLESSEESDSE